MTDAILYLQCCKNRAGLESTWIVPLRTSTSLADQYGQICRALGLGSAISDVIFYRVKGGNSPRTVVSPHTPLETLSFMADEMLVLDEALPLVQQRPVICRGSTITAAAGQDAASSDNMGDSFAAQGPAVAIATRESGRVEVTDCSSMVEPGASTVCHPFGARDDGAVVQLQQYQRYVHAFMRQLMDFILQSVEDHGPPLAGDEVLQQLHCQLIADLCNHTGIYLDEKQLYSTFCDDQSALYEALALYAGIGDEESDAAAYLTTSLAFYAPGLCTARQVIQHLYRHREAEYMESVILQLHRRKQTRHSWICIASPSPGGAAEQNNPPQECFYYSSVARCSQRLRPSWLADASLPVYRRPPMELECLPWKMWNGEHDAIRGNAYLKRCDIIGAALTENSCLPYLISDMWRYFACIEGYWWYLSLPSHSLEALDA